MSVPTQAVSRPVIAPDAEARWIPASERHNYDRSSLARVRYVDGRVDDRTGPLGQWAFAMPGSTHVEAFQIVPAILGAPEQ